jgi:hypothetical protein
MIIALALLTTLAQTPVIPTDSAPVVRPLFAMEKWYQDAKGEEKIFEGVLEINRGDGLIGLPPRFSSFRLISLEDGQPIRRPIHTSGKDQLLSPFIGHKVKLTAKLVESDATGGKAELWPAQMEVFGPAPAGVIAEWKILARTPNFQVNRQVPAGPQPTIIRTAKHLADYQGPSSTESSAMNALQAQLGGTKVDWAKHMIIVISSGNQRAGARIEINKVTYGDKGLDVFWKLTGQNTGNPRSVELVVVNKFDGDVTFYQDGITRPTVIPGPATATKEKDAEGPAPKKPADEAKKPPEDKK